MDDLNEVKLQLLKAGPMPTKRRSSKSKSGTKSTASKATKKTGRTSSKRYSPKKPPAPIVQTPEVKELPDIEPPQQDIIFQPNVGPQTEFLSASENQVLYGGSAGGGKSFAML